MHRGAWWAAVHGVAQNETQLKRLACMHELEKEMATHSSILPWRILGTEEPGGLPSMGSHRVRHDCSDLAATAAADTQFVVLLCMCVCMCLLSHSVLSDFCDPWTVALQVPLFMKFSRQESWNPLLFPPLGIFLTQGLNWCLLSLLHWQADSLPLHHLGSLTCSPGKVV